MTGRVVEFYPVGLGNDFPYSWGVIHDQHGRLWYVYGNDIEQQNTLAVGQWVDFSPEVVELPKDFYQFYQMETILEKYPGQISP